MKETPKDNVPNIEDYELLKEFDDIFKEIPGFPPKTDINFSLILMLEVAPVSNTPYRMSTPELKELQMQLEDILKKGYILLRGKYLYGKGKTTTDKMTPRNQL
jgi:hypothetical protein